jgi:hypothetical protein
MDYMCVWRVRASIRTWSPCKLHIDYL